MAQDEDDTDKPHEATQHKLDEARKKGEIVRSSDLNTAVGYGGFLLAGGLVAPWAGDVLGRLMQVSLGQAHDIAPLLLSPGGASLAADLMGPPALVTFVAMLVPATLLLVILFAQRAILFTPDKLAAKLSRISPVSNARQKFGAEGLFQFAKSAVKLSLVSALRFTRHRVRSCSHSVG